MYNDSETGYVTFGWKEIECEQVNGVLLGYEIKLYYDKETRTMRMPKSMTTYTILPQRKVKTFLPNAISVAAVNELGGGDHSPPVKINPSRQKGIEGTKGSWMKNVQVLGCSSE